MQYPYLFLIIAFFSLFPSGVVSQTNVKIRKRDFKNDKQGFEQAWKCLKEGDHYYSAGGMGYKKALVGYSQAYIYNSNNPELNYKLGVACLFSDKKDEASEFFLKALDQNENLTDDVLLLTGRSFQYAGKYREAVEKYNDWLVSPSKKSAEDAERANKYIVECNSAMIIVKDTLSIAINNAGGNINSDADDYSPVFSADGSTIYFGSRRKLPDNPVSIYDDIKFDENILVSKTNSGTWESPSLAGRFITTKLCETPLFLSRTGDLLYIYVGYEGDGDIFVSENKKGIWRMPFPESSGINSSRPETSFCISSDGNEIFFISERENGLGGKDLYFIRKLNDNRWSLPINAGPHINTPYDEESISLSEGGDSLWFSSKGHNSLGGFDIFLSKRQSSGEWGEAVNAGYPINTPWDELFYSTAKDADSSFFFVSNRNGGFGGLDIYKGKYLPPEPEPVKFPEPAAVSVNDTIRKDTLAEVKPETVVDQAVMPEIKVIYLSGRGIGSNRLEYNGSGSLQPISDNAAAEGRAKNRRIEYKILEF